MSSTFLDDTEGKQYRDDIRVYMMWKLLYSRTKWFKDKLDSNDAKRGFEEYIDEIQRIYMQLLPQWKISEDKVVKLEEEVENLREQLKSSNKFGASTTLQSISPYLVAELKM